MTFSAGIRCVTRHLSSNKFPPILCYVSRSCIGWKFAMAKIQVFLVELVGSFKFELTLEAWNIRRESASIMFPVIYGQLERRGQLLLQIQIALREADWWCLLADAGYCHVTYFYSTRNRLSVYHFYSCMPSIWPSHIHSFLGIWRYGYGSGSSVTILCLYLYGYTLYMVQHTALVRWLLPV